MKPTPTRDFEPGLLPASPPTLFFDGVCNLCNRTVDFVIRRDRAGRYRFAPLQGVAAQKAGLDLKLLESVVLVDEAGTHVRSTAVGRTLRGLGGGWGLLGTLLLAVPRPIRDAGYRFIAQRRYRWWGQRDTCRVPTAEERARFLD